jgi:hypothetical protein
LQVQAIVVGNTRLEPTASSSLSIETALRLHAGIAVGSISVRPPFARVAPAHAVARLAGEVFLIADVADVQAGGSKLRSLQLQLAFAEDRAVCPAGYVLGLDSATAAGSSGVVLGGCIICPPGTYSLNPLADGFWPALDLSQPACLNCLPNATCPGGAHVLLGTGTWRVALDRGMYLLESCPAGHELVDSIGGVFSHDVQASTHSC